LRELYVHVSVFDDDEDEIQLNTDMATTFNLRKHNFNPEAAGREKVIQTQLHSVKRAELADLQGAFLHFAAATRIILSFIISNLLLCR
jgi:hypothetical protein